MRLWESEPDSLDWDHAGLRCAIRRHRRGLYLCGYVGIPTEHPLYGVAYNIETPQLGGQSPDCALSVHGGLTYSRGTLPDGGGSGLWWFGFDCAHVGDYAPGYDKDNGRSEYRDIAYVKRETERLAEQLADFV